jgi:hypothetical protein
MDSVDFPSAYESVCSKMLDHADCPEGERSIAYASAPGGGSLHMRRQVQCEFRAGVGGHI